MRRVDWEAIVVLAVILGICAIWIFSLVIVWHLI